MRPVISASEATRRLLIIFPRAAFDTVMSSPLGGAAISALIYVDAVTKGDESDIFWARPSMVTWMSEDMREKDADDERIEWRTAASKQNKNLMKVLDSWSVPLASGYADNSRETLRDADIQEVAGERGDSRKGRGGEELK